MLPVDLFQCCPRCGGALPERTNPLRCPACGLHYFFNPTCAAAGFATDQAGRFLFIRRAKAPAEGKLAVPGGFIDAGETAEEALRRETREEVGLAIDGIRYVCSCTNLYPYAGVLYPVVDFIFSAVALQPETAVPLDAVAGIEWLRLDEVDEDDLAFPSLVKAWRILKEGLPRTGEML